jgi:hypothetical protein
LFLRELQLWVEFIRRSVSEGGLENKKKEKLWNDEKR